MSAAPGWPALLIEPHEREISIVGSRGVLLRRRSERLLDPGAVLVDQNGRMLKAAEIGSGDKADDDLHALSDEAHMDPETLLRICRGYLSHEKGRRAYLESFDQLMQETGAEQRARACVAFFATIPELREQHRAWFRNPRVWSIVFSILVALAVVVRLLAKLFPDD